MDNFFRKFAITWEEYRDLHPKTRKQPNDPMFSKGKDIVKKKTEPKSRTNSEPVKITKKKPLDEMSDDELIESYKPTLKSSPFQRKMGVEEFCKLGHQMSEDDVAWHVMNSKFIEDDDHDELRKVIDNSMDIASYYGLALLNSKASLKFKNSAAMWMLDKAGVSFVASRKLKKFIIACANKGFISKSAVKWELDSDSDRDLRNKIESEYTPEHLRKLLKSKKAVEEHFSSICSNPNTPHDVLEKLLFDRKGDAYKGIKHLQNGYTKYDGTMGSVADRKTSVGKALKVISNSNFDLESLQNMFEGTMDSLLKNKNRKAYTWALIFGNNKDIEKPQFKKLRDKVVKVLSTRLTTVRDEEEIEEERAATWRTSEDNVYGEVYSIGIIPEHLKLSEKEFSDIYKNDKSMSDWSLVHFMEHKSCPEKILRQMLKAKPKKDNDLVREKQAAFKNLMEKNLLKDKELISTVKENLNLHGDPDILKRLSEHAFVYGKSGNNIARTITKCSKEEKDKLEAEMRQTQYHDQFDYEIVDAYNIDKEPHKDFEKTSKKIGNVVTGLYHGTSFANAGGILSDGVRTDLEARTGSMFGNGFYIATASSKAAQYAGDNFSQHDGEGIVFHLEAALGKSKVMKYGRPRGDELQYRRLTDEEKSLKEEYKKRQKKELIDKWHATHDSVTAKAGVALEYDEYVVKDPSQIRIKKVVIVKKKPKPGAKD